MNKHSFLKKTINGHKESVQSICLTKDDKKIISASDDGTIRIWRVLTNKEIGILEGHTGSIFSICITECGNFLVSGG
jgi:WD40 repeat protein